MINYSTFLPTGAAVLSVFLAGGAAALALPALNGATTWRVQNTGGLIATLRWGAAANSVFPVQEGFENLTLAPGGVALVPIVTDPGTGLPAAPYALVRGSTVSVTPGTIGILTVINT